MWRKSYKCFKHKVAKKSLEEKLFINYPQLKDSILKTKEVLYNMSQVKFLDFNFIKDNDMEVTNLENFIEK